MSITPDEAIEVCLKEGAQGISLGLAKRLQEDRNALRAKVQKMEAVVGAARNIRCLCRSSDEKERHYASCEMPSLKSALAALDSEKKP